MKTLPFKEPKISSVLWSLDKNGWGPGPSTKKLKDNNLALINTCSLSLNATAVLFIGLVEIDSADSLNFKIQREQNKIFQFLIEIPQKLFISDPSFVQ